MLLFICFLKCLDLVWQDLTMRHLTCFLLSKLHRPNWKTKQTQLLGLQKGLDRVVHWMLVSIVRAVRKTLHLTWWNHIPLSPLFISCFFTFFLEINIAPQLFRCHSCFHDNPLCSKCLSFLTKCVPALMEWQSYSCTLKVCELFKLAVSKYLAGPFGNPKAYSCCY